MDEEEKRLRTLTEKGAELYETNKDKFLIHLAKQWNLVESSCDCNLKCLSQHGLNQKKTEISNHFDKFCGQLDEFKLFISRTNTQQSVNDFEDFMSSMTPKMKAAQQTLIEIERLEQTLFETTSKKSEKSEKTVKSRTSTESISAEIAKKKAEAEAARVRMQYAEKEAEIRRTTAMMEEEHKLAMAKSNALMERRKIELEAEMKILSHRSTVEAAEAECKALENEVEQNASILTADNLKRNGIEDNVQRTVNFVQQQSLQYSTPKVQYPAVGVQTDLRPETFTNTIVKQECPRTLPDYNVASELTRFMLKKDLLITRLTPYDDKPETFYSWKSTFRCVMIDLNATAAEELDLLVKYLGPQSSVYARSIRSANTLNPSKGLERVWQRLDERYGSPELIEAALRKKLETFPKLTHKDNAKLYDLCDILSEIEAVKVDPKFRQALAYYDSSTGVIPIVQKLPASLQEKWTVHAVKYKKQYQVLFPPFSCLVDFIHEMSRIRNDPSFLYEATTGNIHGRDTTPGKFSKFTRNDYKNRVVSAKTEVKPHSDARNDLEEICPLHKTKHTLNNCRAFRAKPIEERKKFLLSNGICFRCCSSTDHKRKDCRATIVCRECRSDTHPVALHVFNSSTSDGGESKTPNPKIEVNSKCTQICGQGLYGRSCSKTVLVRVYEEHKPEAAVHAYVIVDDQSNRSLISSELFELLNLQGEQSEFKLTSCSGTVRTSGRRATGLIVESLDGVSFRLPTLIECEIPNVREEIPSPSVAMGHPHLLDIAGSIPEIIETAPIALLIGRDVPDAHHVLEQITGPKNSPYAQRLVLGWVIVGEVCLNKMHPPDTVTVNKTYLLANGRASICKPCHNAFEVKDYVDNDRDKSTSDSDLFVRTDKDDTVSLSIDDTDFLKIMDDRVTLNSQGFWEAPLPFRTPRPRLPNNRLQALRRTRSLDHNLKRDSTKMEHFLTFMQNIFDNGHAEVAPELNDTDERWYLPIFGVYHHRKPSKIRVVFDSSAKCNDISLNDVLLTGPDMINSLVGVLMRFRKDSVAVTADIKQMFFCFVVSEEHRDFLRFIWYKDNNPSNDFIEYRMRVHVFGNSPSPAVASYGLQAAALASEAEFGSDVVRFIQENFYVDDGLMSFPSAPEAIDLIKRTREALKRNGNLMLHKIASNSREVLDSFEHDEIATDLKDWDFSKSEGTIQQSLGLHWNLCTDSFTYRVNLNDKPFSKRGILSIVNSLFDPLGFIAPVAISGKLFLRQLMSETKGWDELLPEQMRGNWERWKDSLQALDTFYIPRTYSVVPWKDMTQGKVCIYCDASEKAIAAVAYLRTKGADNAVHVGFMIGKAKVAPLHGHSIPRLELCAAVLAVQISEIIATELAIDRDNFRFFSDSKVVLGYIYNSSRRFFMYVANRVAKIRRLSRPDQWTYVKTDMNPADVATRTVSADRLQNSIWLTGPPQLAEASYGSVENEFPLCNPENDKEIRSDVKALKSSFQTNSELGITNRCERFSVWKRLINAFRLLKSFARSYKNRKSPNVKPHTFVHDYNEAETFVIREIQNEVFQTEIECIRTKSKLPGSSRIHNLNPFIDESGMLRVGGRIDRAFINFKERHPLIIPGNHHIADLIIRHFHSEIKHQGRHFTAGSVRQAGYWIVGEKRLISSLIYKCVICRKLRGKGEQQIMSDLPAARLVPSPPFTSIGIDTFGPWSVVSRKTRGGQAHNKRWALLFTCLSTRAIHIEVIEEISTSSFINALRRFIALRGSVKEIRSDRGTNFVGSTDNLDVQAINVEEGPVKRFLQDKQTVWIFNPPHSSHMGGIWERMIGITRRILDSMIIEVQAKNLTHEVLTTFLAEVCAIVNGRPIVPVSSDTEAPLILSPSMILTQKSGSFPAPVGTFDTKELYKAQWRRVQHLADLFWRRWNKEYLQTLQTRSKWTNASRDLKQNDIVLMKEKNVPRNEWPFGIIVKVLPSEDGHVRKVVVRCSRNGSTYTRPITELITLLEAD